MTATTLTFGPMTAHSQALGGRTTPTPQNSLTGRVRAIQEARPVATRRGPLGRTSMPPTAPTLDLARACAREVAAGERRDGVGMLFVTGCALAVLAGAAIYIERSLAHWDSFESFVRAVLG